MQTHHTLSMLLREIQRQSMPTIASGPQRCDRAPHVGFIIQIFFKSWWSWAQVNSKMPYVETVHGDGTPYMEPLTVYAPPGGDVVTTVLPGTSARPPIPTRYAFLPEADNAPIDNTAYKVPVVAVECGRAWRGKRRECGRSPVPPLFICPPVDLLFSRLASTLLQTRSSVLFSPSVQSLCRPTLSRSLSAVRALWLHGRSHRLPLHPGLQGLSAMAVRLRRLQVVCVSVCVSVPLMACVCAFPRWTAACSGTAFRRRVAERACGRMSRHDS